MKLSRFNFSILRTRACSRFLLIALAFARPFFAAIAFCAIMVSVNDITAWDDEEHEGLGDFVVLTRLPEAVADGSGN